MASVSDSAAATDIAVVGLACRFPGAVNARQFWANVSSGVESIRFFSIDELAAEGIPRALAGRADYVPAKGTIGDASLFDADFFGIAPREAEITDPQHRLLLECGWHALEDAGYGDRTPGPTAVFASTSTNGYLPRLLAREDLVNRLGLLHILLGNDKDHLATWLSYKLNLTGPSVTVQTACSSSLVAVHLAAQALLTYQCDMAIAGGVTIAIPEKSGYLFERGGILSSDGHCRSFDHRASGSVPGEGVGIVVLRRLSDALASGDSVRAVIKSSAINNDGADKVGFTAPSVSGQAQAIELALALAEVAPDDIGYVETHGSATPLGDPIEVAALAQAFRGCSPDAGPIALGSVKTNIGHAGAAAGVAGFIKTVLALEHAQIPPSLHFERLNPEISFAGAPFRINTAPAEWPVRGGRRLAGVSSFGLGGTNAHVVLEAATAAAAQRPSSPNWHVLPLAARNASALDALTRQLHQYLEESPSLAIPDVAYTLGVGRRPFAQRRAIVCRDRDDALAALQGTAGGRTVFDMTGGEPVRDVAFLFPGAGDQYPGLARGLYDSSPVFASALDRCAEVLRSDVQEDLRELLFAGDTRQHDRAESGGIDLRQMILRARGEARAMSGQSTVAAHAAIFSVEYALAQMWMDLGVVPRAMFGYSLGEYVCACLAGVMSLQDALKLLVRRARLIETTPAGRMVSVPLAEDEIPLDENEAVWVAGRNGRELTVVAGSADAVARLVATLEARGVACSAILSGQAYHTPLMASAAALLRDAVADIHLSPPSIPYVSNISGTWLTPAQATSPTYWADHLCRPVMGDAGLRALAEWRPLAFVEIGPGRLLSDLMERVCLPEPVTVVRTLPAAYEPAADAEHLTQAVARLWVSGVQIDWSRRHAGEDVRRVSLPGYPFERRRFWVEAAERHGHAAPSPPRLAAARWIEVMNRLEPADAADLGCVVLRDELGVGDAISARGVRVFIDTGELVAPANVAAPPADRTTTALEEALASGLTEIAIVLAAQIVDLEALGRAWRAALEAVASVRVRLIVASRGLCEVVPGDVLVHDAAGLWGACQQLFAGNPSIPITLLDIGAVQGAHARLADTVLARQERPAMIAVRGSCAWQSVLVPFEALGELAGNPRRVLSGTWSGTGGRIDVREEHRSNRPGATEREEAPASDRDNADDSAQLVVDLRDEEAWRALLAAARGTLASAAYVAARVVAALERAARDFHVSSAVLLADGPSALEPALAIVAALACGHNRVADDSWTVMQVPRGVGVEALHDHFAMARQGRLWFCVVASDATPTQVIESGTVRSHEMPTAPADDRDTEPEDESLSDTEATVMAIWKQVLGVATLRRGDDFFGVGGNSLLGLRITSLLRQTFDVDLSPHTLLGSPTIAGLATAIEDLILLELEAESDSAEEAAPPASFVQPASRG